MAQPIKMLTTKPVSLSLISGILGTLLMEGENWFGEAVLWSTYMCCSIHMCIHIYTQRTNKQINKFYFKNHHGSEMSISTQNWVKTTVITQIPLVHIWTDSTTGPAKVVLASGSYVERLRLCPFLLNLNLLLTNLASCKHWCIFKYVVLWIRSLPQEITTFFYCPFKALEGLFLQNLFQLQKDEGFKSKEAVTKLIIAEHKTSSLNQYLGLHSLLW